MPTVIVIDIDPATVQTRSRDTEHCPPGLPSMPWSDWQPLVCQPDAVGLYVAFLAAAATPASNHLMDAKQDTTLLFDINSAEGVPIRTIEYQVRVAP